MTAFNIYLTGVGGQGIGMLSEILLRGADHAGLAVKGVDTHGLAQRGGVVVSRIRIGTSAHSPLIAVKTADLVVALERHEAYRAMELAIKDGGCLIYYDTVWQPISVRLNEAEKIGEATIKKQAESRGVRVVPVIDPDLEDPRMQNIAVLARIDCLGLVPGVTTEHYLEAMKDLMPPGQLETNRAVFDRKPAAQG